MWLEVKAVFTVIGIIMLFTVTGFILFSNFLLAFLLIAAAGMFIMGDMIIGIKITKTKAHLWFDPIDQGREEICVLQTISGLLDLVKTTKGPYGVRYFTLHKKPAVIINEGTAQFYTRNGNLGFFGHEDYDKNINLKECKALENADGDSIKEIYANLSHVEEKKWYNLKRKKEKVEKKQPM